MEKVLFEARGAFDKKALSALQHAAGRTTRRRYVRLTRGLDFGFGAVMLLDGIALWRLQADTALTWVMLVLGPVFLALGVFYYPLSVLRASRSIGNQTQDQAVRFTESAALCRAGGAEMRYLYPAFTGLFLWKQYLVLFVDERHALVVDEEHFATGTAEELHRFLAQKAGRTVERLR